MQAFGIFEGGGAKGLAHVAAIAEAQTLGIQFVGVAGASAGAIVAALLAVGYKPQALYDPGTRTGLMAGDLTQLFGKGKWNEWKEFSAAIETKLVQFSPLGAWFTAPGFYMSWRKELARMAN
jgi:predicted acylesterase/phospholipase RssA